MYYIKSTIKGHHKEQDIQPWNAEQSNMLNLIIESSDIHSRPSKHMGNHATQQQKISPSPPIKQPNSFNFCSNLRKYQMKKAEEFTSRKDVNFIQKNIKGVSEDFMYYNQNAAAVLTQKMFQEKHKKNRHLEQEFNATLEPLNWSLIMYYQENKGEKKHRHKDIQSFLRFQSQKVQKNSIKDHTVAQKVDNIEENNKYEGNKYQKLLKLRESLRKRNLKSASQSRKVIDNSLSIEQSNNTPKQNHSQIPNKTFTRVLPKTSQSSRNTDTSIKIENTLRNTPKIQESLDLRVVYTSHRNRINTSRKKSMDYSRLRRN